jgi:hypothetical protein
MGQDLAVDRAVPAPSGPQQFAGLSPLHVVAAVAAGVAIWSAGGPVDDYDSYWHVALGGEILHRNGVHDLASRWLAVPEPPGWVTSQWLAEVIMHSLVSAGGWQALNLVRLLAMVGFVAGLALVLLRGHRPVIAVPVFVLTLGATAGGIQDRPQTAGLLFLVALGHVGVRLWTTGQHPPLWSIGLGTLLWAQLHGTWVLAPIAFLLVAVGGLPDAERHADGGSRGLGWRGPLLCLLASLTGVLNPHGVSSFLLPLRFAAAGDSVTEWWPTTFGSGFTLAWGILLMLVFVAWARTITVVPWVEVLWVIGWTAVGLQSYRNVGPAVLLTAPAALVSLERLRANRDPAPARPGRRESWLLAGTGTLIVLGSSVAAVVQISTADPLTGTPGRRIAAWVAQQPGPVRIFNNRESAGTLAGLSDGKARLIVDGRADLWGANYLDRIMDAEDLRPGTLRNVTDFAPDAVVTRRDAALITALTADGWHVEITDRTLVLLLPDHPPTPRTPSSP